MPGQHQARDNAPGADLFPDRMRVFHASARGIAALLDLHARGLEIAAVLGVILLAALGQATAALALVARAKDKDRRSASGPMGRRRDQEPIDFRHEKRCPGTS